MGLNSSASRGSPAVEDSLTISERIFLEQPPDCLAGWAAGEMRHGAGSPVLALTRHYFKVLSRVCLPPHSSRERNSGPHREQCRDVFFHKRVSPFVSLGGKNSNETTAWQRLFWRAYMSERLLDDV